MQRLLRQFLQLESASGVILFMMAMLAMIWANSPLDFLHKQFLDTFLFWINEGLMAIFFLVVGLELKRGYLEGRFSTISQIALPTVAALGGMFIPAVIYVCLNLHDPVTVKAWATPVATDIAFALAVLSLFGRRVPYSLKMFLLALAIIDDLGAIIIIAFFYSHGLSYLWLCVSFVLVLLLYLINVLSVRSLWIYLPMGILLWAALWRCGVHPTIAGVLLALAIPGDAESQSQSSLDLRGNDALDSRGDDEDDLPGTIKTLTSSPLDYLENQLHPWVAYLIMPLFALANAGFSLSGITWQILTSDVVVGIVLGLVIGKQAGVFLFSWLLIRCRLAKLPQHASWLMLYGIAILCGIGFTMSLFLGTLSFQHENILYLTEVRLGVIAGSILSGLAGAIALTVAFANKQEIRRNIVE